MSKALRPHDPNNSSCFRRRSGGGCRRTIRPVSFPTWWTSWTFRPSPPPPGRRPGRPSMASRDDVQGAPERPPHRDGLLPSLHPTAPQGHVPSRAGGQHHPWLRTVPDFRKDHQEALPDLAGTPGKIVVMNCRRNWPSGKGGCGRCRRRGLCWSRRLKKARINPKCPNMKCPNMKCRLEVPVDKSQRNSTGTGFRIMPILGGRTRLRRKLRPKRGRHSATALGWQRWSRCSDRPSRAVDSRQFLLRGLEKKPGVAGFAQ